jgi:hypothetical protein
MPSNSFRDEHCHFAVLNNCGKCIAACHLNDGNEDCKGIKRISIDYTQRGEVQIVGRKI